MSSAWITNPNILFLASLLLTWPILGDETKNLNAFPCAKDPESKWVVSADFLAWFASEEVASIWNDVVTITPSVTTYEFPSFDFKWDYGFRIGVGYDLEYDQWDTAFYWSWFRTDTKHTIPSQPNTTIGAEFDAAFLADVSNLIIPIIPAQSMSAQWSLLFNMFDWELGRRYWVSKDLCIRPFLGLQGGWINQSIQANYYDLTILGLFNTHNSGNERLKNNFWGIGPLGGINTQWKICHFGSNVFDFFGDLSAATMWGTWTCSDVYKSTFPQSSSVDTEKNSMGALMLRGFWGIGWDVNLRGGKSHFAAKLGFETQLWLNQLRIATFQLQRLHHDLTLQGITFNARFDF